MEKLRPIDFIFGLMFCISIVPSVVSAEEAEKRPLLEFGLGGGGGVTPDYPGSDQSRFHQIAFPVFYYHGKIFRSDRDDGARARVVNKPVVAVDVSGSGGFPVDADENRAREGMPALKWLGEMGPRLYVRLRDSNGHLWRTYAVFRPAFTTDLKKWEGRGFVYGPGVSYEKRNRRMESLSFHSKLTALFATREYHDYFYSVDAAYVTPARPQYQARGGYLGVWWSSGVSYEYGSVILSTGVSMISTRGAANTSSPLFRDDLNWSIYGGLAWFFYHSDEPGYQ